MLNCKISSGVQSQCETSIGGILKLAFANFSTSNAFTQSTGSCEVDTISLADSEKAYEVSFLDGTGLAEVELNVGDSTDQKNFTHRITMNLAKLDCSIRTGLLHTLLLSFSKRTVMFMFMVQTLVLQQPPSTIQVVARKAMQSVLTPSSRVFNWMLLSRSRIGAW